MTTRKNLRRSLVVTATLSTILVVLAGLPPQASQAIIDGAPPRAVEPYDGSLQRIDSPRRDNHVCGATLVAPRWAITAGHCLGLAETPTSLAETGKTTIARTGNPVGWQVRFGSRRVDGGGRLVDVEQFVRASRSIDPEGDVALLRLGRAVRVEPAVLASRRPAPGTSASIRGWGFTGKGGIRDYESARSYPNVVRAATTRIAAARVCGLAPAQSALCVGTSAQGAGPDNMDSGGPVFVREAGRTVLAGTVNGGNYVSGLRPSVYTDLSAHRRWVRSYVSGRRSIPGPQPTESPGIAGSGTITPSGCSTSVVRTAASVSSDPAMVLTNGHCLTRRPEPGRAYADRPSDQLVNLLGADSNPVARATTTRLLYATMTGTDVAVYRLRESYAELASLGVPARVLATQGPVAGDSLVMHNGSAQTTSACTIKTVVSEVRESGYTQRDALRYAKAASCAPGVASSGSPLVDRRTGEVVAVHNSHVVGDRKPCREDNPCEVGADGSTRAVTGRSYAQQVAALTRCLAPGSVFDPSRTGCTLPVA